MVTVTFLPTESQERLWGERTLNSWLLTGWAEEFTYNAVPTFVTHHQPFMGVQGFYLKLAHSSTCRLFWLIRQDLCGGISIQVHTQHPSFSLYIHRPRHGNLKDCSCLYVSFGDTLSVPVISRATAGGTVLVSWVLAGGTVLVSWVLAGGTVLVSWVLAGGTVLVSWV